MKEFYWRTSANFGDALNQWLWETVFPELMDIDDQVRLIGVGSLLRADLERVAGLKVIFGTGAGYGSMPDLSDPRAWRVYFVRGPLTARAAGLPETKAIVDASWLVGHVEEFRHTPPKRGVVFIPHYLNAVLSMWPAVCREAGVEYVDPLNESRSVLSRIAQAELVISESLHGAILADYFRTPWIPVRLSDGFLDFKWLDWCRSIGVNPAVWGLPPTDLLDHLRQRKRFPKEPASTECKLEERPLAVATHTHKLQATRAYAFKQYLKIRAHWVRESALRKAVAWRDPWPLQNVHRRRNEQLAGVLLKVAAKEPNLSLDSVHREKVEQLADAVESLKRDYAAGLLSGPSARSGIYSQS